MEYNLGKNIRDRRRLLDITQKELAKDICTQSQISKIEKNEVTPMLPLLIKISERLQITIDDLLNNNFEKFKSYKIEIEKYLLSRDYIGLKCFLENIEISSLEEKNRIYIEYLKLIIKHKINNFDISMELCEILKKNIDNELKINVLNSLGNIYFVKQDYDKAIDIYNQALNSIYMENYSDNLVYKVTYNYMRVLYALQDYQKLYDVSSEMISICFYNNNFFYLPEFIYSKYFSNLKLEHKIIDKEELKFALFLAKKQNKAEIILLINDILGDINSINLI